MATIGDPRAEAEVYLKQNNVKQLFRDLGTKLMFERPTDPNACGRPRGAFRGDARIQNAAAARRFLLKTLEEMQEDRSASFFTDQDVRACFQALDPNNTGKVSVQQYDHALKSLGIEEPKHPLNPQQKTIDKDQFIQNVSLELKMESSP